MTSCERPVDYRFTIYACYVANLAQAVVTTLTPLLFLILKDRFGLSYSQFGLLVLVNFCTQVTVDIACSKAVDQYGFRGFMVVAHLLCVCGFVLFAVTPWLFPGWEFGGFLAGTVLFAGSGGLFELLLSPIIDALPTQNSAKAMSFLHSMYAWGTVGCILITTLALFMGVAWYWIMLAWALLPLANSVAFFKVPLRRKVEPHQALPLGKMAKNPLFLLALGAILFGGAAEVTIAQWTSTYLQNGLGVPKLWGDLLGMGGFALMLGLGRVLHGLLAHKLSLPRLLVGGAACAVGSYLLVALSPWPSLGILGCVSAGLFVSLLWPGTVTTAAAFLPTAGASMFALLAAGGDIGAALGPWLTGFITDGRIASGLTEAASLRFGMLCAVSLPLLAMVFQLLLHRATKRQPRL